MSLILKCCALALVCVLFGALLKERASAFVLPLELAALCVLALIACSALRGRFASLLAALQKAGLELSLLSVLLKGAGITLTAELCAAVCRESGHAAVADGVALVGRAITLVLCLPLVEAVLKTAVSFV